MNTLIFSFVLFLAIIGNVQSRDVKFSIITFGKKASVNIPKLNDTTVELKPSILHKSVQTVYVNGCPDEEFEYSYIIDGEAEPGVNVRKLPVGQTTTYNELIGRQETISKLKGMGYPEDQEWTRSYGQTELFDDSYIPTIIIDNSNVPKYFTSPYDFGAKDEKTKIPLNGITFILKETIFTDKNVETAQKSRYNDKVQFKVKLNDGHKLYKRKSLKFRASGAEDPSFLGESLYSDLAQTIGNPVHDKVFVRVYLEDGTPIGLYNMIDVTASKSFLKTEFYGDVKGKGNKEVGAIFECHSSDFEKGMSCENKKVVKDSEDKDKDSYSKKDEENDKKKIAALVEAFDKVDVNNESSINEFSKKWLDLDSFFKALCLEYLCGHWDSYWEYSGEVSVKRKRAEEEDGDDDEKKEDTKTTQANNNNKPTTEPKVEKRVTVNKPTNYVLYQDPRDSSDDNYKFFFIDQDFDQTFGVGKKVCGPECSYKQLIAEHQTRAAKVFLREGTLTRKKFENHLKSIVQHVFNPVALGRRIEEYERRYAHEILWDFNDATFRDRQDRNHTNRNLDHSQRKAISYSQHQQGLEDIKKYIEDRAKTVTKDLDFEWDATPMEPVEREIVIEEPEKQQLKFEKSAAPMNMMITTKSTILTVIIVIFLQLII
jgi:hypothetical protein